MIICQQLNRRKLTKIILRPIILFILTSGFILFFNQPVFAQNLATNFGGIIDAYDSYGDAIGFDWGMDVGDPFELIIAYDLSTPDNGGSYPFDSADLDLFSFNAGDVSPFQTLLNSHIDVIDGPTDYFKVHFDGYNQPFGTYDGPWTVDLILSDSQGLALNGTGLPNHFNLNDFDSGRLDFEQLMNRTSFSSGKVINFGGYSFSGDINSINVESEPSSNVVPEPSTIFLLGSGLLGAFARRRKRS